ncbi:protein spire homolog 2 isoform X2 [Spea bombifrons]|uniref:protein spire homolog 2 isoform X2 n=1 Tax=Spea bombifrons TaxID=233779 RepID=UPI0023490B03|nr:protein spire homolog 2 isoform X2 [Spea bombifrons]
MAKASSSSGGIAEGSGELSLEQVLKSYEQPINEEQAWAVCYQCSRGLAGDGPISACRIRDPSSLLLHRDGTVTVVPEPPDTPGAAPSSSLSESQMVQCLGFAIYRALDWGLDESEERELSPQLEQLIDLMVNSDSEGGLTDEGYEDPEDEDEEGPPRVIRSFASVLHFCASRLPEPHEAQAHYQAVCRALFAETVELKAFLKKIREAKEVLKKLRVEESEPDGLVNLQNTDWARLWVQLMRDLRHGVQLKKVRENTFNSLPTEYQLTPFEMLMQDIRARNYKLRKVMVRGDIPPKVKKDAHELILDFIRSRPPLKPVSHRNLPPLPLQQRSLHEKILEEIKQEPKLRPVTTPRQGQKGFGSLPCIVDAYSSDVKSTSCINLSAPESSLPRPRPRVLLKAPTLAEMEEMNLSEEDDSPSSDLRRVTSAPLPLKRDRSFSEHDLAQLQTEMGHTPPKGTYNSPQDLAARGRSGSMNTHPHLPNRSLIGYSASGVSAALPRGSLSSVQEKVEPESASDGSSRHRWLEFSHPVDTLALTVEEVINVRRVLVKAEMEKFLPSKELYTNLKKGKVCCCCRMKFPLFSWPATCLFCKRSVCGSCNVKMKLPAKKLGHIPVYTVGFETHQGLISTNGSHPSKKKDAFQSCSGMSWKNVEAQFSHIYAQGSVLKDVCSDCAGFIRDVVCSSRKSVDLLNKGCRAGVASGHGRTGRKL